MISIITPIYKVAEFIERCAVSLFEQTYRDIEYIFVDDYSPDDSVSILQKTLLRYPHRQSQVKIIRHTVNRGVAAARNSGLQAATGQYIYYVDADDWIEKDAIETMFRFSDNGNVDIVSCGWFLQFCQNERKMPMPCYSSVDESLRGMLSGQLRWNLWLYMIKRELYERYDIHYIEGENVGEDMLVLIKLFSRANTISFVDRPLYHYVRQNVNSITQMTPTQQMNRLKHNLQATIDYMTTHFGDVYQDEIYFFKLNAKLPLLITDDESSYRTWKDCFPEADSYIMKNCRQSLRMRLVQLMAAKGHFWIVKLYYRIIFKFVYGVLYK